MSISSAKGRGHRLASILAGTALFILLPFYMLSLFTLTRYASMSSPDQLAFWWAFAAGTVLFAVILRPSSFVIIFEHEFTHMLWCLIFFKRPKVFEVKDRKEGHVSASGSNILILLAPYFCPTLNLLLLGLYYVIDHRFDTFYFAVFGLVLGYHTSSTLKEFHHGQPDMKKFGAFLSGLVIVFGNILSYGVVLAFVFGRGRLALNYAVSGCVHLLSRCGVNGLHTPPFP